MPVNHFRWAMGLFPRWHGSVFNTSHHIRQLGLSPKQGGHPQI